MFFFFFLEVLLESSPVFPIALPLDDPRVSFIPK